MGDLPMRAIFLLPLTTFDFKRPADGVDVLIEHLDCHLERVLDCGNSSL